MRRPFLCEGKEPNHVCLKIDPDTGEMDRKRRADSDSDSDLSAMENPDFDLASSHSSDDDDDDNFAYDTVSPRQHGGCQNVHYG